MNADLEDTLRELGPGYREMVVRMRACFVPRASCLVQRAAGALPHPLRPRYAIAAALILTIAVSAVFITQPFNLSTFQPFNLSTSSPYTLAFGGEPATGRLVASQRADGSWENDFLTRQNAAAIRGIAGADVAYRKAVRYLRSKGLSPLTDDELRNRAKIARTHGRG